MKTQKIIITATIAAAILAAPFVFSGNDMTVMQNADRLVISQVGTELDPVMVDGNGMTVKCLEIKGKWIYAYNFIIDGCLSHGVLITGQHISFYDSTVRHTNLSNRAGGTACSGSGSWGSAIKMQLGAEYVSIHDNKVYENCGEGIAVTRGKHVIIQNNVVRDNYSVNIYVDNSPFTDVINNESVCTGIYLRGGLPASGILLGIESYPGWGNQMHDVKILSNRITGCRPVRLYSEVSGGVSNVEISYNVFTNVQLPYVRVAGAVTIGNVASVLPTITPTITPTKTPTPTATNICP